MKMIIQSPDFKARKTLTGFVEENIAKLEFLSDRIQESRICLRLDKSDKRENKICEIRLVMPGNDLFAARQSSTFEDAVLQAVQAIKRQVQRWKGVKNKKSARIILAMEAAEPINDSL